MQDHGVALGEPVSTRVSGMTARSWIFYLTIWYLASRVVLLSAITALAAAQGTGLSEALVAFDGGYYKSIASSGYPGELPVGPDGVAMSSLAFFPLFPAAVAAPVALGVPFWAAALLFNLAAGLVATLLVYKVVLTYANQSVAAVTAAVWCVSPMAFVLTIAYSEALYSALAFACLLALLRQRWLLAGVLAAFATATRPSGVVLVLCAVVALVELWRRGAMPRRALLTPVIGSAGFLLYMAFLWGRTGRADAWFVTQREGWGVKTDGGAETLRRFFYYLANPTERPAATAVSIALILIAAAVVFALRDRPPAVVGVFAAAAVLLAVTTQNAFSSIPRFVLPATFVLLVPLIARLWPQQAVANAGASASAAARRLLTALLACASLIVMTAAGAYATVLSTFPP